MKGLPLPRLSTDCAVEKGILCSWGSLMGICLSAVLAATHILVAVPGVALSAVLDCELRLRSNTSLLTCTLPVQVNRFPQL